MNVALYQAIADAPVPPAGLDVTCPRCRTELCEGCDAASSPVGLPAPPPVLPSGCFVARYLAWASRRTDAPPAAHELMALAVLSALAGPKVRLPIATSSTGWPLVLWVMYIADSTQGRKTIVVETAREVIASVLGPEALLYWEGSPQGMLQRLQGRDGQTAVFIRDEYSGLLQQMNAGGHLAGLPQLFMKAFDGQRLENSRTSKRTSAGLVHDADVVDSPYLVKLCASVWTHLVNKASTDNVVDGLLPRFLVVTATSDARPLQIITADLRTLEQDVRALASSFYSKCQQAPLLRVDPDALAQHWILEQRALDVARHASRPEAAYPMLKRLVDAVLKIAALFAIDDAPVGTHTIDVTAAHVQLAGALSEPWQRSALELVDTLGQTRFRRDCDAIKATLRANGGELPYSALYRAHRSLHQKEMAAILGALREMEEIDELAGESKGPGRKPKVVRLVAGGTRG